MAEYYGRHPGPSITGSLTGATRSSRSSTLPSQQAPDFKHRHRHRHHNSTQHKSSRHGNSVDETHQRSPASHTSHLSPLGELLSPVRRNVTEGLSGVAGWIDRDRDREKDRSRAASRVDLIGEKENLPNRPTRTQAQVEQGKRKQKTAERLVEEKYNQLASQTLKQHEELAASRSNMLQMFRRLDSTLTSLSALRVETESMLDALTTQSIPEITEESTRQLETFRTNISNMETSRIRELQVRVDAARESTTKLGARMAEVRTRIRIWEEKDAEEDRRRRRRVGFVWGTMGVITLLIVLLLIWGRVNEQLEARDEAKTDWIEVVIEKERQRRNGTEVAIEELLRSLQEHPFRKNAPAENMPGEGNATSEREDQLLSKLFDEL